MRSFIVGCLVLCCAPLAALAQDSSLAGGAPHLVHTARVYLDAYYTALRPVPSAVENMTFGNASYAPFVTDHWQVGVAPDWQLIRRTDAPTHASGSAATIVNYVFRDGASSRPYVGAFLQHGNGWGIYGVQAGWLRFVTPSVALRAEARYRQTSGPYNYDTYDVLVRLDPYLFGRATRRLTSLPGSGTVDVNFVADYSVQATAPVAHTLWVSGLLAPFITRWLQVGTDGWFFYEGGTQYQAELFGRAYLPIDTRLLPFAELFHDNQTSTKNTHGARAGLRAYLTRGVALDVALQWIHCSPFGYAGHTFTPPEQRVVRAGLTTQFGRL